MPEDGVGGRHFELFEEDIEGVNAVIVLDNSAGARDLSSYADLDRESATLNLLSLSSLKTKEVGPVSWTR